ncbi:hypothetical protein [Arthrobacter sp. M4]|uniref:hypothetical protein n=1 Tax=Arthrobacter sp. M4 TaxID=218160 RepID=UPI001CDC9EDA|nr:hypothetical protein [Arthrobacter sp. M4]MCA4134313.1 hypothetical protein [Arthrobacter sp. M4]
MAEKGKSILLPFIAAAVVAGLGRLVIRWIRSQRAQLEVRINVPQDAHLRAKISEFIRQPGGASSSRDWR